MAFRVDSRTTVVSRSFVYLKAVVDNSCFFVARERFYCEPFEFLSILAVEAKQPTSFNKLALHNMLIKLFSMTRFQAYVPSLVDRLCFKRATLDVSARCKPT